VFELTTTERNKPFILMGENERLTKEWVEVMANARHARLNDMFDRGPQSSEPSQGRISIVERGILWVEVFSTEILDENLDFCR